MSSAATYTSNTSYQFPPGLLDSDFSETNALNESGSPGKHGEWNWHGETYPSAVADDVSLHAFVQCVVTPADLRATNLGYITKSVPWLRAAIQKLSEFKSYAQNWDSYNSPPLSDSAIENAKCLLSSLNDRTPAPFIAPVSGGGVQFEWQFQNRELEIEFCQDGRKEFLKVYEDESMEEGEISSENLSLVLIDWLLDG